MKRKRPATQPRTAARDPGYYLIANGRVAFEQELGFRMPIKTWLRRAYVTQATSRYLGTIAIVSAFILSLFLFNSGAAEVGVAGSASSRASRSHPGFGSGDRISQS